MSPGAGRACARGELDRRAAAAYVVGVRSAFGFLFACAVACGGGGSDDTGSAGTTTSGSTSGATSSSSTDEPTSGGSTSGGGSSSGATTSGSTGDVTTGDGSTGTGDATTGSTSDGTTGGSTGDGSTGGSTGTTGGGDLPEGAVCQNMPDACAPGLLCCYPCGVPDCENKCLKPDPNTDMCPLFP